MRAYPQKTITLIKVSQTMKQMDTVQVIRVVILTLTKTGILRTRAAIMMTLIDLDIMTTKQMVHQTTVAATTRRLKRPQMQALNLLQWRVWPMQS